jgi:hypothetical protein
MIYTNYYVDKGILNSQLSWIKNNLCLETITGSQMYGTNNENSDIDFIAIIMPQHQHLYPQNYGYILGFDDVPKWDHSECKEGYNVIINKKPVEGEWVSLVNFFYNAAIKGSPNLIEVLFAKRNLVTQANNIGWMLRDNRKLFLSVRHFHSFKGYAFQQLQRIKNGYVSGKSDNSTRQDMLNVYGYDLKMANHCLRLIDQIKQVLINGDIDLQRNRKECIAMRKGEWGDFLKFEKYVLDQLELLETLSLKSKLPQRPAKEPLHELLNKLIEEFYGSFDKAQKQVEFVSAKDVMEKLNKIEEKLNKMI